MTGSNCYQSLFMLYKAQFPESLYIPKTEESLKIYESRVTRGEKLMSKLYVAIVGLARDIESVFPYTKARVEQLQKMFHRSEIIIVENDSEDNTKKLLQKWHSENDYVDIISSDYNYAKLSDKSINRRKIMTEQRNLYMKRLSNISGPYHRIDYVIVLDTDISGGFSYNGIANSFGFEQDWSCMSGNSIIYRESESKLERLFYDTWAKRNYGSWNETCGPKGNKDLHDCGNEPILVYSNFGGIAIYKYNDIKDLRYLDYDCDHVTLNKQLIDRNKNIYLNPSMITLQTPTYISRELCYQK